MIIVEKNKIAVDPNVGGKARGLAKLACYGYNVPDFFVISSDTDIFDEKFAAELRKQAENLHSEMYAVRSSNVEEDGADASFAGQFATELNVKLHDIYDAVLRVAKSINANRADLYRKRVGKSAKKMSIIVQAQVNSAISGVLFTSSPFDECKILVEQVSGLGEALVGGETTPSRFFHDKNVPTTGLLEELRRAALSLEMKEKSALDLEWCFDGKLFFVQMRPQTVSDDALPAIPQAQWHLYVYRDFCNFCHSVQIAASDTELQSRLYGFGIPITQGLLVCGREFYTDDNDRYAQNIWCRLDKDVFWTDFINKLNSSVRRTRIYCKSLLESNLAECSNERLLKVYHLHLRHYIESYVPLMMRPDDYLQNKLRLLTSDADQLVEQVMPLARNTYYGNERRDFLRATVAVNPSQYLRKYSWTYAPLGKGRQLNEEDFSRRSQMLSLKEAKKNLADLQRKRNKSKRNAQLVLNNLHGEIKDLLKLIVGFIGMRTYTAENSDRYFFYFRHTVLREICRRFKLEEREILAMTYGEVERIFVGYRLNSQLLNKRERGSMTVFNSGEVATYYGSKCYDVLSKLSPPSKAHTGQCVYGDIACRGEVTAPVKLVYNFEQVGSVQYGDIVVTSMTTPDITEALDKASGIITDEGGITCHAAIISREYGIPCLVGTQCATRLLHDGMIVKLNCLEGYFQILYDKD